MRLRRKKRRSRRISPHYSDVSAAVVAAMGVEEGEAERPRSERKKEANKQKLLLWR